jgi:hypothetical protein
MRAIGNGEGFKNKKPLLRKSAVQHYQNAEFQNMLTFFKKTAS